MISKFIPISLGYATHADQAAALAPQLKKDFGEAPNEFNPEKGPLIQTA